MDIFDNKLNIKKFQYTNKIWNELGLNKAWSIGVVSKIIYQRNFRTKEEWKEYYFESGKKRLEYIKNKSLLTKSILIQPNTRLNQQYIDTNYNYGRTEDELNYKGFLLYDEIIKRGNPMGLTINECQYAVKFRVICETWNGIIKREQNTIETLKNYFKDEDISFKKTNGDRDALYEVDYDVFVKNKIICGLQIKPKSYLSFKDEKLKKLNLLKNKKYKDKYNADVLYIYSQIDGTILNKEIIKEIKNRI